MSTGAGAYLPLDPLEARRVTHWYFGLVLRLVLLGGAAYSTGPLARLPRFDNLSGGNAEARAPGHTSAPHCPCDGAARERHRARAGRRATGFGA